jgi:diaminopimelate epimerase
MQILQLHTKKLDGHNDQLRKKSLMTKNPNQNLAHRREHFEEVQSPNQQHYTELKKSTSTHTLGNPHLVQFIQLLTKTDIVGKLHDH